MYKNITPAQDWYWVGVSDNDDIMIHQVACWATLVETGYQDSVIGLIGETPSINQNRKSTLIEPPTCDNATYKHASKLSKFEKKALEEGGYLSRDEIKKYKEGNKGTVAIF